MKSLLFIFILFGLTEGISAKESDQIFYGATASIDINPEIGIPLAGYGAKPRRLKGFVDWLNKYPHSTFFRPSEGRHDPIRAKVVVVIKGIKKLVFVSVDTIGVEYRFIDDLLKRLKPYSVKRAELFVSGTHTHSGPGTLSRKLPLELVAVDLFKQKNYNHLVDKTVEAIRLAFSRLEIVTLHKTSYEVEGLQRNKWRKDKEFFDNKVRLLVLKDQSQHLLGGILNFAVHGGALGSENLLYSADLPGTMERTLEEILITQGRSGSYHPTFAFMNGAEGDVGAKEGGFDGIKKMEDSFRLQSLKVFDHLIPVVGEIQSKIKRVWIGTPSYPISKKKNGEEWKPICIPIVPLFEQRSYLSMGRIGDLVFLSWPGEPTASLGFELQKLVKNKLKNSDPWIFSLTNDYMTYFVSKDEYREGSYDAQSALFGYRGGERIMKQLLKLAE
jgi:neutral ceramidase